jgi:hypothetical protein
MPPTVLFSEGMSASRRRVLAVVVVLVALAAPRAQAQDGFRITYEVDQSKPGKARVAGRVANERSQDVFEVSVTAEALDARGRVLARGIAYVDSRIAPGDSRTFTVSVPSVAGVSGFRVVVSSFRPGFSNQGP